MLNYFLKSFLDPISIKKATKLINRNQINKMNIVLERMIKFHINDLIKNKYGIIF
jgi:hypothetical protein